MGLRYCPKDPDMEVWDDPYCRKCGAKTEPYPTCCGQRIYPQDNFCGKCGKPVQFPQADEA